MPTQSDWDKAYQGAAQDTVDKQTTRMMTASKAAQQAAASVKSPVTRMMNATAGATDSLNANQRVVNEANRMRVEAQRKVSSYKNAGSLSKPKKPKSASVSKSPSKY